MDKLYFTSDYMEGAHPAILQRLAETNLVKSAGYGSDGFSESARQKIREACRAPEAEIHFLAGGTQANATVISTMLKPWQGVIAAQTGHVALHEAGAIEAGGHKVILLPQRDGKLSADDVRRCLEEYEADENREHMGSGHHKRNSRQPGLYRQNPMEPPQDKDHDCGWKTGKNPSEKRQ